MIVKLLTEHHLEFLSLKRGCRGSSESTLVKMPHCCKSHALVQISIAGFRSLEVHDQSILLQSSIYPIVLLYLSKFYDTKTKRYNFFNFTPEETSQILKLFPMLRVLVQHYQHVGEMVSTLRFTNEEFALFAAILLCPAGKFNP